jgi:protein-S-isoprenylcysteine O-methyltransferase Ste14
LLPLVLGVGVWIRCIHDFTVIGRGTLAPVDPPRHLVVRGLYRYVRNPMYVGVLAMLSGEAVLFRSPGVAWEMVYFFCSVHLLVVFYEEPVLKRQFNGSYEEYCRQVHRWIPTMGRNWKAKNIQ